MMNFLRVVFLLGIVLGAPLLSRAADGNAFTSAASSAAFNASIMSLLKDLKPETQQWTFVGGTTAHWRCLLHRKFTYIFSLDVAYDAKTGAFENLKPELSQLKRFIADSESDTRGRLILENNTSGLPAVLILMGRGASVRFQIHHPLHDIVFTPADRQWTYLYSGAPVLFAQLPEIKRAQDDAAVGGVARSAVRVSATGNPKTYFDCTFTAEGGKMLKVRVEGKDVKTLSE